MLVGRCLLSFQNLPSIDYQLKKLKFWMLKIDSIFTYALSFIIGSRLMNESLFVASVMAATIFIGVSLGFTLGIVF